MGWQEDQAKYGFYCNNYNNLESVVGTLKSAIESLARKQQDLSSQQENLARLRNAVREAEERVRACQTETGNQETEITAIKRHLTRMLVKEHSPILTQEERDRVSDIMEMHELDKPAEAT